MPGQIAGTNGSVYLPGTPFVAIADLRHHPASTDPVACSWLPLSVVSQPVSFCALRHYRNRLARR